MKAGDVLLIGYTVYVSDEKGERVVDTTYEDVAREAGVYDPSRRYGDMVVIYGRTSLIQAVEEALATMAPGDVREIIAQPEKAYGERREDLVIRVPVKQLQRLGIPARVGAEVDVAGRRGVITRLTERFAYIDLNHPLAGKTLRIKLELKKLVEDPQEKARLLAARAIGIRDDVVQATVEPGVVRIKLPLVVVNLSDLDARLRLLISYIKDSIDPEKLEIVIEALYRQPIQPEKEPEPEQVAAEQEARAESPASGES